MAVAYRLYRLPWDFSVEDDRRFHAILRQVAVALLVLTVVLSLLPVPERDPLDVPDIPPQLARFILEEPEPQPAPAPPPPPVEAVEPEPLPEPVQPVERVPEPVEAPPPPVDTTRRARETAAKAGVLAFADELADLRDNQALGSVTTKAPLAGAVGEAQRTERALITANVGRGSGGINTAALSRDTGGTGLASRGTTRVASTVAGNRGAEAGPDVDGDSQRASRSREEIEMVFDQNKSAIYALYNRALRQNPALQGKLVLRLTIEPSGAVSSCEVVTSELGDADLERKLVARVKMFRFPERDVAPVTTTKPIDFFPA